MVNQIALYIAAQDTPEAETPFDWTLILMLGVLAVFMFFMFRSNKKRKQQAEEMQDKIQVGVDAMTSFGLYGTVRSIDEEHNVIELETSPGTVLRVHRQVVTTVVEPDSPSSDDAEYDGQDNNEESQDK